MDEQRPNPEKLLQQVMEEERQQQSGKLKIYLGAAPGVGKTYTMLQDAIVKRKEGLDVVVGVVETHGRQEIEALIKDLEILPQQMVDYHGKQLKEFDIDATLKRNPSLILMDEMAHTNAPGLRHTKRWQDIKEILDRGIDVYTTLNVQHIESLNDVVSQIIGTHIKETVPDSMLELAETIEMVDLAPEDLIKRLHEGKVYFPAQAELATENFFRKGNLIALRELALRAIAERVGAQVLLYRHGQGIERIWPTQERLLVCVGHDSASSKIIRATKRMATNLRAEWIAIHVDTPRFRLSDGQRNQALQNLRLAEQLGAETKTLTGLDCSGEILNFARERNITKIIIGKQVRSRWRELIRSSLVDELVRQSGDIDVYIITGEAGTTKPAKIAPTKQPIPWKTYAIALGMVALCTLIDFLIYPISGASNLIMVYLLGVTAVALFGEFGPSIFASTLSVLTYAYFFITHDFNFSVKDIQYSFTLLVMLVVAQIISHLTVRTRRQTEAAHLTERRTSALHILSRQLASTRGVDKLLEIAVRYLSELFACDIMALLPEGGHLMVRAKCGTTQELSAKEQSVAQWVFDLGQIAGLGTDTLPFSDATYVPLLASQGTIGVLRVHLPQSRQLLTSEQMHLLEACANQVALALEVDRLQDQAKKSELQIETDRVRNALLQTVSHDLRTPLGAAMGAASTLSELGDELDARGVKKLGKEICIELEHLSRLMNNLLQMTYLEAETVKLQKEYYSLNDTLSAVTALLSQQLGKKPVYVRLPRDLPKIPYDQTLISEVFSNLIDNVIKFTAPKTPIEITAIIERGQVLVSVEDYGPGIVADEVNKLFEKFYRGRLLTTERGLGLGLAICHRIITAHGGEIWAENRTGGGAAFRFTLPLY